VRDKKRRDEVEGRIGERRDSGVDKDIFLVGKERPQGAQRFPCGKLLFILFELSS